MITPTGDGRIGRTTAFCSFLLATCVASAQVNPASTAIPADALIAVEWAGASGLAKSTGARTPFQLCIKREQISTLITTLQAAAEALLGPDTEKSADDQIAMLKASRRLLSAAWEHGVSAALLDVTMEQGGPNPQIVIASPAGASCGAVASAATDALQSVLGEPAQAMVSGRPMHRFAAPVQVHVGCVDETFLCTLGEQAPTVAIETLGGARLALHAGERLAGAMHAIAGAGGTDTAATDHNLLFRLFIDVARIRQRAVETYTAMTGNSLPEAVALLLDRLGVMSLDSITMTESIAGGAHRHSIYFAAPGPKRALLKLFDADPIIDADLAAVSADAIFAIAVNLRAGEIFDDWLQTADSMAAFDPSVSGAIRGAIARWNERTGIRFREDVIATLGDTWVIFDAPSLGGLPIGSGTTLVVDVKDVDRADQLMTKASQALLGSVTGTAQQLPHELVSGELRVRYVQVTGLPVPVAPAWGFAGQRMVVAMYPQLVRRTLERLSSPTAASRSILENADFLRARKSLPASSSMVVYLDSARAAQQWYRITLPLMTAAISVAAEKAPLLNAGLWPSMDVFASDLFGEGWAVSKDKNGVLIVGQGPWPVPIVPIDAAGPIAMMGAMPALMFGANVHWPVQDHEPDAIRDELTLEPANETPSATETPPVTVPDPETYVREKLEALGTHCQLYAMEHQETYPPDLKSLIGRHGLKPTTLATPAGIDAEFHYLAGQTIRAEPNNVLIYCTVDDTGGWVLTVAGELHRHDPESLRQVVDETKKRIAEESTSSP